jgi:hypothetical protein
LKFAKCFFFKDSFWYTLVKIVPHFVTPLNPWRPWFVQACQETCKYELFWLSGAREDFFLIASPYRFIFVTISTWTRTWPSIWTNFNSIRQMMICTKFNWNWLVGSGEKDFFNRNMVFLLWPLSTPWDNDFNALESPVLNSLYSMMICTKFNRKLVCLVWRRFVF